MKANLKGGLLYVMTGQAENKIKVVKEGR